MAKPRSGTTPAHDKAEKVDAAHAGSVGSDATQHAPATLDAALLRFTVAAINGVSDATVRETFKSLHTLATAVQKVFAGKEGSEEAHDRPRLTSAGATPDKVLPRVVSALALMDIVAMRDKARSTWQALTDQVNAEEKTLDGALASQGSSLRGAFGNTSSELTKYGFKPLGGGGKKGPRAPKGSAGGTTG